MSENRAPKFQIQPDELRCKLQQLMIDMNKFYSTEQPVVNIDEVKVGQAYAVKRDADNLWCRCGSETAS